MDFELRKHYELNVRFSDSFKLYLSNQLFCISEYCFKHKYKFNKLFNESTRKINKMLDISKMMRNNRLFKTLFKNSILNKKIKDQIEHTEKYLIDIDSSISESHENYEEDLPSR